MFWVKRDKEQKSSKQVDCVDCLECRHTIKKENAQFVEGAGYYCQIHRKPYDKTARITEYSSKPRKGYYPFRSSFSGILMGYYRERRVFYKKVDPWKEVDVNGKE